MAYDAPGAQVRHEIFVPNLVGQASASLQKYHMFQATRLKAVHALIVTAGTNTGAGFDVYVGTASVGAVVCGTNTAGVIVDSGLIDAVVPAKGLIEIKGKPNSATLVASLTIEHQPAWDATLD
jgi:hypothetical protein